MHIQCIPLVLVVLSSATMVAAESSLVGAYGFDWLNPESATCRKITADLMKTFRTCNTNQADNPGFGNGITSSAHCKTRDGEWIIYGTKAQCEIELSTMEANAP